MGLYHTQSEEMKEQRATVRPAGKKGRPSVAEQKIIDDQALAEHLAVKLEKRKAEKSKAMVRDNSAFAKKSYKEKNMAEKMESSLSKILTQFAADMEGKPLLEVDYFNKESVDRRKSQLTVYKDVMSVVRQMRDLIELLKDDEAEGGGKKKPMSADNLVLLDSARELLKSKGIKDEL